MVQRLRLHPPASAEDVDSIPDQGDSTWRWVTKPMFHNYRAHALEPGRNRSMHRDQRAAPAHCNWGKPTRSSKDAAQPKTKNE